MTRLGYAARVQAEELAREAARYLEAVDLFAALGADPHAAARAEAARKRARKQARRPRRRLLR